MTRISLVDLDLESPGSPEPLDRSREHCIILMDNLAEANNAPRVRERSLESEARESPSKRPYSEENLVFETHVVDVEGEEQTMGAIGMVREEAAKLSWRHFRNYMIRNGGIEKCFSRKSEVRVFYIDDEDDEIFVDTDDEYRELLKIASAKNKIGETMALKFISFPKSRRGLESRRRSCGERRQIDLFGREVKSPGKVMKHQVKHFDTVGGGKVWKMNSSKTSRGKVPGKLVSLNGTPPPSTKPLTIADGLNEVKELSRSLEETRISSGRRLAKSPETYELLRQQASVFEWMNKNAADAEKDLPPVWFLNYMETYREEMAAEITTKVVHSLGIVIDNKFQQLLDRRAEAKVDESDFAKKVRKDKIKVKKVKTEALRMTMELGEESIESKELKKLKKSLIKKTDKVVKVAMKIEKKNHQEQKGRKTSLSSSSNAEQLQAIKLTDKKEKKAPKVKEEKKAKDERKAKKGKPKKDIKEIEEEENCKNAGDESQTGTTLLEYSIPVVTSQPRQRSPEVVVPGNEQRGSEDLPGALLLPNGSPNLVGQMGQTLKASVAIVNLGCTTWGEEAKVERSFSSEGLTCPTASQALPQLQPGQEGELNFQFTAPLKPGRYESVWHFWLAGHRFGPPLAFNISVAAVEKKGADIKEDTELLDFSNGGGQEMLSLGSSATALEMVEMGSSRKGEFACLSLPDLDTLSLAESSSTIPLESAISASSSSSQDNSDEEDDFEVIPLPDCFNLEVPFELIDQGENENQEVEVTKEVNSTHSEDTSKKALSMASGLKTDDSGSEEKDTRKPLKEALAAVRLVEEKLTREIAREIGGWVDSKTSRVPSLNSLSADSLLKNETERNAVSQLVEVGFANREENLRLLRKNGGDINKVLQSLCTESDQPTWAERRH